MNAMARLCRIGGTPDDLPHRPRFEDAAARIFAGRRRFDQQNSFLLLEIGRDLAGASGPATYARSRPAELDLARLVAERLVPTLRGADVVGRIAPNCFAIVPAFAQNSREAAALAERLIETVRGVDGVAGETVAWFAAVGIARFPVDGTDVAGLLDAATAACRRCIDQGANQYCFCSESLSAEQGKPVSI